MRPRPTNGSPRVQGLRARSARLRSLPAWLLASAVFMLLQGCETDSVTEPPAPDPSVAGDASIAGGLDCGWEGRPCRIPPLVATVCRDVWQEKDGNGNCVCKYDWMEKDEDGWCVNKDRPDDGGGGGGGGNGNTGEGSEGDSITFIVRVDCRTALTRSETVTCAAETRNGTGSINYVWTYTPESGGVRIWDRGTSFESLNAVSEAISSNLWEGTAVHGGDVKVVATDEDGNTDDATTDFTVSARVWSNTMASAFANSFARTDSISQYLYYNANIGLNVAAGNLSALFTDILQGDADSNNGTSTAAVAGVRTGPNKGYGYVKSQAYVIDRRYRVNIRLESRGPVEIPDAGQGDTVNHWTYMTRRGWGPQALLDGVIRHEGRGDGVRKGHQGQIEVAATAASCGDAATLVERIVANSEERARRLREQVETNARESFEEAAYHHRVHGHFTSNFAFWAPGLSTPVHIVHSDAQGTGPGHSPRPECDWSSF